MKKAFTIVELLTVIAVIAVLMGIVTTAASSSLRASRKSRAQALCKAVQVGLATYYAQKDTWPTSVSILNNPTERTNREGLGGNTDASIIVLKMKEASDAVRDLVNETKDGNPLIDVSALFVSMADGRCDQRCAGADFLQVATIKGMSKAKSSVSRDLNYGKRMSVSQMKFGYPDKETGYFRHFKMRYSIPADELTVSVQDEDKSLARYYDQ